MGIPGGTSEPLLIAACELLRKSPDRQLKITVLNKALFYADLTALLFHGNTITGKPYIALRNGPVVGAYDRRIVRGLARAGWAEQILTDGTPDKPMRLLGEPPAPTLSKDELQVLRDTASWLHRKTATWVSNFSHENPGWKAAFAEREGTPINMLIALQQLQDEGDAWLRAPLADGELSALDSLGRREEW